MTDATIVVLVAAVPTTIASMTAAIVAVVTLIRNVENTKKADATDAKVVAAGLKTDTLIEKTAEIHTLTNSANADLKAQLELIQQRYEAQLTLMQQRYDAQSEVIRQMLATAADQAATRVLTDQRIAAALATPAPATTAEQNLAQIEVNTADTAALLRPKTP